jgi:hypothetical protein
MKNVSRWLIGLSVIAIGVTTLNAQTDKRVTAIRSQTVEINKSLRTYKKNTVDVPGISTEGAEATIYRSGNEIKKIIATIYGESFKAASEFYFADGKLIFSFDSVKRYKMPPEMNKPIRIARVDQIRGYFADGKMFRLLQGTKAVASSNEEFNAEQERILGTVESILEAESTTPSKSN